MGKLHSDEGESRWDQFSQNSGAWIENHVENRRHKTPQTRLKRGRFSKHEYQHKFFLAHFEIGKDFLRFIYYQPQQFRGIRIWVLKVFQMF